MDIYLFVLVFCGVLGLLVVLYAAHFRYRAMVMGPERLRNALSRVVAGEGKATSGELMDGLSDLFFRLRKGISITLLLLVPILVLVVIFTLQSLFPGAAMILSALCLLLVAALASLILVRDILRLVEKQLQDDRDR